MHKAGFLVSLSPDEADALVECNDLDEHIGAMLGKVKSRRLAADLEATIGERVTAEADAIWARLMRVAPHLADVLEDCCYPYTVAASTSAAPW